MADNPELEKNEQEIQEEPGSNGAETASPDAGCITMSKEEFEQVRQRIEKLQSEYDNIVALAQRIQADFDNYRKRNASVRADSLLEGTRNLIKELLPVLDNFDRAMDNCTALDEAW